MDRNMKKLNFLFLMPLMFFVSCATSINMERVARLATGVGRQEDPASSVLVVPIDTEPEPIIVERPIYIPQASQVQPAQRGREAVSTALSQGVLQPQDYSNAAMLYDYDRDFVYEVYCRPFRVSDITLQPNENVIDVPFISDSERWMLGAGVSYENGIPIQHIYVKPTVSNLEATLIINTDLRVYHLILRSFPNVHMPIVRWRYHHRDMPQNFTHNLVNVGMRMPGAPASVSRTASSQEDDYSLFADPRFLSFNYRVTWGLFRKPRWAPTLVYDDGKKTYITFPNVVLQTEFPAVYENRADIINYRVFQNIMVIDKLVENITIRLGDRIVTVQKLRGR